MRKVECDLKVILDLICCAEDYGFAKPMLLDGLAEITGPVTDAEIIEFAAEFMSLEMQEQGYGEEDQQSALERLTEWRDQYARSTDNTEPVTTDKA